MPSIVTTTTAPQTANRPPLLIEWLTPSVTQRQHRIWRTWTGVVLAAYLLIRVGPLTSFVGIWQPF